VSVKVKIHLCLCYGS